MNKDLTVGSPQKAVCFYSLPMFVSVVFQQFYNMADSVIAGRFVGENALAAVGASYPVTMLFMAVAVGSSIGCSVVISQLFGAKRFMRLKTAVSTIFISTAVISVVLSVLGVLCASFFMGLVNTPQNIFSDSVLYFKIYTAGFVFLYLYNIATGVFNSLGDSKTPLMFLIGSSVGNVILDVIFVSAFKMGIAGLAWATFAAQGVACVLALFSVLKRMKAMETEKKYDEENKFSWQMLFEVSRIAVPSILQQSFISVGNLFIQIMVNGFGSSVIAGYSAAVKLNTFAVTSITTLGNGISGFTAQNVGAGKTERVKEGFKAGYMLMLVVCAVAVIPFFFFGRNMLELFMDSQSQKAIETGVKFLKIVSPFYAVVAAKLAADGVLRGSGAMGCFMVSTFTDLILRVLISFVLAFPLGLGSDGIWMSWPIGWVISSALSVYFYIKEKWLVSAGLTKEK